MSGWKVKIEHRAGDSSKVRDFTRTVKHMPDEADATRAAVTDFIAENNVFDGDQLIVHTMEIK